MVPSEKTQAASLVLTLITLCLLMCPIDIQHWGISRGCGLWQRLAYPFLHASLLHCALNCWCLLSIVFFRRIPLWQLIAAYLIAITYPIDTLSAWLNCQLSIINSQSTVGLSGVCFALLGIISLASIRCWLNIIAIGTFICVGFLLPNINASLHLYCYLAGLLVSLLTTPIIYI